MDQVLLPSLVLAKNKKRVNPSYTVWTVACFPMIQIKRLMEEKREYIEYWFFCLKHKEAHFGKGYKKVLLINDNLLLNGFWKFLVSIWAKFNLMNTQL